MKRFFIAALIGLIILFFTLSSFGKKVIIDTGKLSVSDFMSLYNNNMSVKGYMTELHISCKGLSGVLGNPQFSPEDQDSEQIEYVITNGIGNIITSPSRKFNEYLDCIKEKDKIKINRIILLDKQISKENLDTIRQVSGITKVRRSWVAINVFKTRFFYF